MECLITVLISNKKRYTVRLTACSSYRNVHLYVYMDSKPILPAEHTHTTSTRNTPEARTMCYVNNIIFYSRIIYFYYIHTACLILHKST